MNRKITCAFVALLGFSMAMIVPETPSTPWESIGGCGAGGSGGGSSDGIKWVGQGVNGGLVEAEVFAKENVGENYSAFTLTPHFSFKPMWSTSVGVTIPFVSHSGEVQYRSNQAPVDRTTGGIGDISFDVSQIVGSGGAASLSLSLSIPTGQYDIKRGTDASKEILPSSFQKGSGLYSATLGWNYTRDTDKGMWLYSLSYTHPFNVSFTGENEFNDSYFKDYKTEGDDRFDYYFKGYGENDLGAYTPPSATAGITYAYRGQENFVHSFGVNFSVPFGVAWISSEKVGTYDPRPDPDHKAWSMAFVYGLEFSRSDYPIFLAFSLPLHDKANAANPDNEYDPTPMEEWNLPDFDAFLQEWTLAIGIKASFL
ncbi:MAG: hypothetical protein WCR04_12050 [Fibrobacteraceae bacterium]